MTAFCSTQLKQIHYLTILLTVIYTSIISSFSLLRIEYSYYRYIF